MVFGEVELAKPSCAYNMFIFCLSENLCTNMRTRTEAQMKILKPEVGGHKSDSIIFSA